MRKRTLVASALGVSVLIGFGGLYASNMGFKLNQLLAAQSPGISATGQTQVGLPYNPQTSIVNVSDLRADINATAGASVVFGISRFIRSSDEVQLYTGSSTDLGNNFPIDGVAGLRIQVTAPVNYIIVGSHDPGRVVNLDAAGTNGSATGQFDFSFPYHGTATNASQLRDEINAASASGNAVFGISRFVKSSDEVTLYTGASTDIANNFATAPGESYRIQVTEDVAYVPSHY